MGPAILAEGGEGDKFVKHVALLLPEDAGQGVDLKDHANLEVYHVSEYLEYNSDFEVYALAWFDDQGVEVLYDHLMRPLGPEEVANKPVDSMRGDLVEVLKGAANDALVRGADWIAEPAHPPVIDSHAHDGQNGGTEAEGRRRFSCVGFVVWCFAQYIGCKLVQDNGSLPEIQQATGDYLINTVYELPATILKDVGLNSWPKRLLLPGYVIHALENGASFPYQPRDFNDAFFPDKD